MRDTLYDLRTDVSESQNLAATLEAFLDRVKDRSGLGGPPPGPGDRPPPAPPGAGAVAHRPGGGHQRRAPRPGHPGRHHLAVRRHAARLEVADDGIGFPVGKAGRLDSYGILGMRERAASIGATLDVDSEPGRGHAGTLHARRPVSLDCGQPDRPSGGGRLTIRLLLADDHRMLREGLRRSMTEEGFDVVGEAENGEEAVRLAADAPARRGPHGRHDARARRRRGHPRDPRSGPDTPQVIMLTMHADQDVLAAAIRAGASGYLVKDCSTDEVADAVRMAASGDTALSPQLAASMLDEVRRLDAPTPPTTTG